MSERVRAILSSCAVLLTMTGGASINDHEIAPHAGTFKRKLP